MNKREFYYIRAYGHYYEITQGQGELLIKRGENHNQTGASVFFEDLDPNQKPSWTEPAATLEGK